MKKLTLGLWLVFSVICHAASPSNPSFENFSQLFFKTNGAPPWRITIPLSSQYFDWHGTNGDITITNVSGVPGATNVFILNGTNSFNYWQFDTNTSTLSPSITPAFVAATNILAYGLYAEREFMLVNQGAVALALGANDVPVAGRNTISVNGTTTTADDSLLNIDNGNGFGQLLILRNNSTNQPTFTMHASQAQTLDATKTNRLKGDWIPQTRGESLWLWNDGFGFVEVDRTDAVTDFGVTTNIFQNIIVTNLTAYDITVTQAISHDRIFISNNYISINGTNLATINPTDGYIPYRINTNNFGDSQFQQVNTTNTLSHGSIIGTNDSIFTTYSDGTAANPAFSFGGFANGYGLFRDVNGEPSISIAALDIARFSASGFRIPTGNSFDWSIGSPDTTPIRHGIYDGNGTPEGVLVANVGSLYLDYNGGGVWKKTSDSGGNTGWVELGTGGSGGSSLWTNLALAFQPIAQYTNFYFGADIFASGTNNGQNITLLGNRAGYQAIFDSATHDVFGAGFYPFRASVFQGASDVSAIGQNSLATSYLTNSADIHGWGNYALFGLSATNSSNIYGKGHSAGQGVVATGSGNLFFDGNESGLSSYFTNSFDISAFNGAFKGASFTNSANIIGLLVGAGKNTAFSNSYNLLLIGTNSTAPLGAANGVYLGNMSLVQNAGTNTPIVVGNNALPNQNYNSFDPATPSGEGMNVTLINARQQWTTFDQNADDYSVETIIGTVTPDASNFADTWGLNSFLHTVAGNTNSMSRMGGSQSVGEQQGSGSIDTLIGSYGAAISVGSGSVSSAFPVRGLFYTTAPAAVDTASVFDATVYMTGGTATNVAGLHVNTPTGAANVHNLTGVLIEDQSGASVQSYNIWSKGSTALNYLEGPIAAGTTNRWKTGDYVTGGKIGVTVNATNYNLLTDNSTAGPFVLKSGDTMTGPLLVTALTNSARTVNTFVVAGADKSDVSTATSAMLAATLSDETGTGAAVFGTSPTFSTSLLIGPSSPGSAGFIRATDNSTHGIGFNSGNIWLGGWLYVVGSQANMRMRSDNSLGWSSGTDIFNNGNDLMLSRDGPAVLQLGLDAASVVNQAIKAHDGSGTDKSGANLTLEGGQSTGTGTAGAVDISTAMTGEASGSTANAYNIRAHYKSKFVALTDATTNEVIRFSLAANKVLGGQITVTTYATNSTPHLQCRTTVLAFQAVAVGTAITPTIDVVKAGTLAADSGTMTETFTIVDNGGNTFSIIDNVDSDLTSPTDRCKVVVTALNGNAAVTITDP